MEQVIAPPQAACATNDANVVDRTKFSRIFIAVAAAVMLGYVWNAKPQMSPNDNARWNTIWSLVDFGTYQIFDTEDDAKKFNRPKQLGTIDKVVVDGKTFSSKPPLFPTIVAGYAWCVQRLVREPFSLENPKDPKVGTFPIYSKTVLFAFNVLPYALFLVYFARLLERFDLAFQPWLFCMLAAATGTFLTGYLSTLNNHTLAAQLAFFTGYHLIRMHYDGRDELWRFAVIGFLSTLTATCELPAGLLAAFALVVCLVRDVKKTLIGYCIPAALVTVAFFWTNQLAIGTWKPAYTQKALYDFPGSYWTGNEKSGIDALNDRPEPKWLYLIHMTVGHHGLFSLTPIWAIAAIGAFRVASGARTPFPRIHWPILIASGIVFVFYWWFNSERNYGGFCHGMRWLLWLAPFWLLLLPAGLNDSNDRAAANRGLDVPRWMWCCLAVSCVSMADTLYNPWTRAWLHRIFLWFGIVDY